jgi:hypothetical protein
MDAITRANHPPVNPTDPETRESIYSENFFRKMAQWLNSEKFSGAPTPPHVNPVLEEPVLLKELPALYLAHSPCQGHLTVTTQTLVGFFFRCDGPHQTPG